MINTAKDHSPQSIKYITGDASSIPQNSIFQIIVSIMTLQFIDNLEKVFSSLINHLQSSGIFLIADFNKEWVKESLRVPISFADFDSNENPYKGWKTFGDLKTPVYIRDSKTYDDLALKNGLIKFMESYPPFTQEFIQKYPDNRPKNVAEYLILGYKKK
jgi:ubiquinone/menaquinone biosynthesis C-methylase UbiE